MSTPTLTKEAARQLIARELYTPAFVATLEQEYGEKVADDRQLTALLQMAGRLAEAEHREQVKQAADRTTFYDRAADDLDRVLQAHGMAPAPPVDARVKQAAAHVALDPTIRAAFDALNS